MITDTHPLHAAMAEAADTDFPVELRLTCGTVLTGVIDYIHSGRIYLFPNNPEVEGYAPLHVLESAVTTFRYTSVPAE